jgi:hypothetical protein
MIRRQEQRPDIDAFERKVRVGDQRDDEGPYVGVGAAGKDRGSVGRFQFLLFGLLKIVRQNGETAGPNRRKDLECGPKQVQ